MNKPSKLPEIRKEAFTKARETLGLSTKDLSGMTCLSVRQIEQIENGESSSYYGAQNKVTAAKKVAGILHLKEEDAFDFGDASSLLNSASVKDVEAEHSASQKDFPAEKKSKISKIVEKNTVESKSVDIGLAIGPSKTKKQIDPKKRLFFLLGVAAALVFSVVNLRPLFFPEPPKEEVVVVEEVVQAPVSEEKPDTAPPAPVAVAPVAVVSTDCPVADVNAITYKPDAPKKAGDMVYMQSKIAQTVCVVEAGGKTQVKALEPGVGISVYGKAPLKVLTGGLNQVDLYYQGAKVRIGGSSGKTIVLEPAELSQPAAPSTSLDSQLR